MLPSLEEIRAPHDFKRIDWKRNLDAFREAEFLPLAMIGRWLCILESGYFDLFSDGKPIAEEKNPDLYAGQHVLMRSLPGQRVTSGHRTFTCGLAQAINLLHREIGFAIEHHKRKPRLPIGAFCLGEKLNYAKKFVSFVPTDLALFAGAH
jgi:hypothetical protein